MKRVAVIRRKRRITVCAIRQRKRVSRSGVIRALILFIGDFRRCCYGDVISGGPNKDF